MLRQKSSTDLVLIALVLVLITISSCSQKPAAKPAPAPYIIQEQIERDFLIIRDQELRSFLQGLVSRLIGNFAAQVSVEIVNSPQLLAHSYPSGLVIVSSSLLEACNSESELAFVLAHEFGHIVLGHHANAISSLDSTELRERELAADLFGAKTLTRAGYSLSGAYLSIQRLTSIWDFYGNQSDSGYPPAAERLMEIQSKIFDQSCLITGSCLMEGVENTREFARFRQRLRVVLST
jgi:predicted Zn-dependent protease